jgi:pullulanase
MGGNHKGVWRRAARVSVGAALALTCLAAAAVPNATLGACDGPFATVLQAAPAADARAYWLNRQIIKWPGADNAGIFKLYYSATAQLRAAVGSRVTGADGSLALARLDGAVPADVAQRFKFTADGALLAAPAAQSAGLLKQQVMIVLEAEDGTVRDATALQIAGALDDLYASAASSMDLGVTVTARNAAFKLWAPTAQRVALCTYASGSGKAAAITVMQRDDATGIWSANIDGKLSGQYYQYLVDVVAPGAGLVRNLVTDPYSVSLTTDSKRSYIADLNAPASSRPAGTKPRRRKRSRRRPTCRSTNCTCATSRSTTPPSAPPMRGKYTAFTEARSNGMQAPCGAEQSRPDRHPPAAGLRHRQRAGKAASCRHPAGCAGQREAQQALVKDRRNRLLQLGLRPVPLQRARRQLRHDDPADGAVRVVEFREMVQACTSRPARRHGRGLQPHLHRRPEPKSVLDRIVPGYYHRLDAKTAPSNARPAATTPPPKTS